MDMYQIDRIEWAKLLNMSTRTVDRYIRSWRLRSKKIWKKIFLHSDDVEILKNWWIQQEYEIIEPQSQIINFSKSETWVDYKDLYEENKKVIEKKDEVIKDLSYRLGNAESELKNSISLLEYKKATFLLESSTIKTEDEKTKLNQNISNLESKIKSEKKLNFILIFLLIILIIITFLIWFKAI